MPIGPTCSVNIRRGGLRDLAGWPVQAELPEPKAFAAASQTIPVQVIAEKIICGPSAERHPEAIGKFVDAGFHHVIRLQIGPDQEYFVDFFCKRIGAEAA